MNKNFFIKHQKIQKYIKMYSTVILFLQITEIDAEGGIVCAGFIDIQINGCFGVDWSDIKLTEESFLKSIYRLFEHGCTAICPTMVTSSHETYEKILPILKPRPGNAKIGPNIFGAHTEGPFMNPKQKGAHNPALLRQPVNGIESIYEMYGEGVKNIKWITMAPELEGAQKTIPELRKLGIVVSCGHTDAKIRDMEDAMDNGASLITHLFNAMTAFHHRDPGVIGALGFDPEKKKKVHYGIIVDGIHSHPHSVNIAYHTHPDGLILVTDALAGLGMPLGHEYKLGPNTVQIVPNIGGAIPNSVKAVVKGTDTLGGSIVSMIECVRNMITFTSCDVATALECASLHPAIAMEVADHKGSLKAGMDADFVILTKDLYVKQTWIDGELAYKAE